MMFNADFVPVGKDQVAHVEITRDIARRFNNIYKTEFFNEPVPKLTQVPLLSGLDGNKMVNLTIMILKYLIQKNLQPKKLCRQ